MNDLISLVIAFAVMAVCISACLRSRYWARRAEAAATTAKVARDAAIIRASQHLGQ
jgi:hypothetical protein